MSVDRFDYSTCGVCARNSLGGGYLPRHLHGKPNAKPLWICDDPECLPIARNTYGMRQTDFDRIETMAAIEAGHALETFCEGIQKSDFASFTQEEFEEGIKTAISAYREALKVKLKDEAPF